MTVEELKALFGINISMGLNPLPQYKPHWHQNDFTDKSGVKNTMTYRRYQKLTQYIHVSDRANEPAWNSTDYDKMYMICPVLNMVWDSFVECYKPGQNQTIDEGIIAFKGRLSYVPAKPIKTGIKMWMHCDADTAYLHLFEVYLGLGYDVVMKLCKDISGKNHHVYCDNLFTSVQLLKDLLACKTYCNGTIWVNMRYHPEDIHKPGRTITGACKPY